MFFTRSRRKLSGMMYLGCLEPKQVVISPSTWQPDSDSRYSGAYCNMGFLYETHSVLRLSNLCRTVSSLCNLSNKQACATPPSGPSPTSFSLLYVTIDWPILLARYLLFLAGTGKGFVIVRTEKSVEGIGISAGQN
jgi:hypothetical protein